MILLEYPGINGLTTAGQYKNCLLLSSINFGIGREGGVVNRSSSTGRTFGSKMCDPITVSREQDHASTELISQALLSKVQKAKIYFLETGNRCKLEITLTDCLINKINISAHGGGDHIHESFYLTFTEIEYRSIPLTGSPRGSGFNLVTGEGA